MLFSFVQNPRVLIRIVRQRNFFGLQPELYSMKNVNITISLLSKYHRSTLRIALLISPQLRSGSVFPEALFDSIRLY